MNEEATMGPGPVEWATVRSLVIPIDPVEEDANPGGTRVGYGDRLSTCPSRNEDQSDNQDRQAARPGHDR